MVLVRNLGGEGKKKEKKKNPGGARHFGGVREIWGVCE
jgi:hypothetical protein